MPDETEIEQLLSQAVDPVWYRARYRDVDVSGANPLRHFMDYGMHEQRDPNAWFDGPWYVRQYPDAAAADAHPLLHYLVEGAARGHDPHPRFNTAWYVEQHPEATGNPMLFHLRIGAARAWPTERPLMIEDYLPSILPPLPDPAQVRADVVIPVYRGLETTRRCLESVLADTDRPPGRIIVIDDRSPEPEVSAYLTRQAKTGAIKLLRNKKNLGFVASVNRGMAEAGDHDVALLNSDTEVPVGWLRRLRAQAYARARVGSVSPLSNNATICSYPDYDGGPIPDGMTLAGIDASCQVVNAGRFVPAPTTVGYCMYIRRAALNEAGLFDVETFGLGYGEENDFCRRSAALGWSHHIACDTFVWHEGNVSFGPRAEGLSANAYALLTARYPNYETLVVRHVENAENAPFRFAITMALFRASGLPTVLLMTHELGGGVRRHIKDMIRRDAGRTNYLMLEPAPSGAALSVPALTGHPTLVVAPERWRDLAAVARSGGVTRVHIHHLMGHEIDTRALIHALGVPFDVTVHDYFAICPQITLLPWAPGPYCGEPGPDGCDACIASRPSHGATDILSWRLRWSWQFREADRVFTPSQDTLNRLSRYGLSEKSQVLGHERVEAGAWPMRHPARPGQKLRVAVLGVLADHKGAHTVASVAMAADPAQLEIQLLGHTEDVFPEAARARMRISGPYEEGELPALLEKFRPHVIWFPMAWPETYSYTLSAAIDAGLPIVATDIGALPERVAGRPMTWLRAPSMDPAAWLTLFDTVAETLRAVPAREIQKAAALPSRVASSRVASSKAAPVKAGTRTASARAVVTEEVTTAPARTALAATPSVMNVSVTATLAREAAARAVLAPAPSARPAVDAAIPPPRPWKHLKGPNLVDARREGRMAVLVIPETLSDGALSPCAHIRLLRPLDHPLAGAGLETTMVADAAAACRYRADIIATQRHAIPTIAAAEALAAHARRTGAMLLYDLDDDLLTLPPDHPDAAELAPKTAVVERMIRLADIVRVSMPKLAARAGKLSRAKVQITGNALDERIWLPPGLDLMRGDPMRGHDPGPYDPVRILCMGTATHDADFTMILPALMELHTQFGTRVQVDLIGFLANAPAPAWIGRVTPPPHASRSYAGFVQWFTRAGPWDIGLAPLVDSPFNASKSPIKTLDYAALGLATLASDVPSYRGSVADGHGGMLVPNTTTAWYEALSRLVRDHALRRRLSGDGLRRFQETGTLAAQGQTWQKAWGQSAKDQSAKDQSAKSQGAKSQSGESRIGKNQMGENRTGPRLPRR